MPRTASATATWTQALDAGAPALREYDQAGHQIDEVSASDLFAWHAYVPTGAGIYYAIRGVGGFALTYVRNSDSASLFLALATGLRPFSRDGTCATGCGTAGAVGPTLAPGYDGAPAPDGGANAPDSVHGGSAGADSEKFTALPNAVMKAIPEPASVALLLGGLAGLLVLGRVGSGRSDRARGSTLRRQARIL